MPSNVVKSIAKETNKSTSEVEKLWNEAKKDVESKYEDVSKGSKQYYKLTTEITKKKAGMKNEAEDGDEEEETETDGEEEEEETNESSCGNRKAKKESKKKYKKESEEEEDDDSEETGDEEDDETNESGKKKTKKKTKKESKKKSKSYKESVEQKDFQTLLNENLEIVNTLNDNVVNESVFSESSEKKILNESLLGIAAVVGAVSGYTLIREFVKNSKYLKVFDAFFELEDQQNVVSKRLPRLIKKSRLVSSLNDLNQFEKEAEEIVSYLEFLTERVEPFVDDMMQRDPSFFESLMVLNPQRMKVKFKREMLDFVNKTRQDFEYKVEQLRDEMLD